MKLNIKGKLLLPVIGVVTVIMLCSTWISSTRVQSQLTTLYMKELDGIADVLLKNVQGVAAYGKTNIKSIALDPAIIAALEPQNANNPDALAASSASTDMFKELYKEFPVINIVRPDGLVIAGSNRESINKVNVGKRAYFQASMRGETVISAPLMSMDIHDKATVVSTPIKGQNGNILGVLYAAMPSKTLIANTVQGVKVGKTGYAFIADEDDGLMVAHPDYALVVDMDGRKTAWGREVFSKRNGQMRYLTEQGVPKFMSYRHAPDAGWIVIASMDEAEIDEAIIELRNVNFLVTVVGLMVIGLVVFLIVRPLINALKTGVNFAKAVAEGDLDQKLLVDRNDELGELAQALQVMVANLKTNIENARQESERAREESTKAREAMRIAEAAGQEAQGKTEAMLRAADKLEEVANIVTSASTELSAQIEHSENGAIEQAARVTETATAMEEMNSTVLEVAKNAGSAADVSTTTRQKAEAGAEIVRRAVNSIQGVQRQSLALKTDMATLDENARSISQIMSVISDIADQTNLLALNAAIEAARAGEAGRGFAVVADEVRKLAEKTMASTTDVGSAITAIQQSTAKSMTQMDEAVKTIEEATDFASQSGAALDEIVGMVDSTADQVRAIATASEQQSASSEEINQSINQINGIAGETARAMEEAARAVADLSHQAQVLSRLIEDMKRG